MFTITDTSILRPRPRCYGGSLHGHCHICLALRETQLSLFHDEDSRSDVEERALTAGLLFSYVGGAVIVVHAVFYLGPHHRGAPP
jgi:hypothetical protein